MVLGRCKGSIIQVIWRWRPNIEAYRCKTSKVDPPASRLVRTVTKNHFIANNNCNHNNEVGKYCLYTAPLLATSFTRWAINVLWVVVRILLTRKMCYRLLHLLQIHQGSSSFLLCRWSAIIQNNNFLLCSWATLLKHPQKTLHHKNQCSWAGDQDSTSLATQWGT